MLKRIYIDNYKSLVNFEVQLNEINLFLGINGSGKSAVFEVLNALQDFVCDGVRAENCFRPEHKTRWQNSPYQSFELEIENDEGLCKYQLSTEHYEEGRKPRVKYERLFFEDRPLLRLEEGGEVHLYRDDFSEGPVYPADESLSAVGAVPERPDNTRLSWFKKRLRNFIIVQVIPPMMSEESPREASHPSCYLENFISWYRHLSQDQGMAFRLISELKEVLPGFDSFRFKPVGERHRLLKVYFRNEQEGTSTGYKFNELSDGQRMIIGLYTLLYAARSDQNRGYSLCLDEPENFLALSEIQPWLTELYDRCSEGEMQSLLISHHPEFINYLLASPIGYWFERESNRPTRIRPITAKKDKGGLPLSEIIARGWLNE